MSGDWLPAILSRKARVYVVATGAGAGIQEELWRVPGASSFLAGAEFPYAQDAIHRFLGFRPKQYACQETAIDLAMGAYLRAVTEDLKVEPVGLAVSASVASIEAHRGDHRVHVAVMTRTRVLAGTMVLEKGTGAARRAVDGDWADMLGLDALAIALGESNEGAEQKLADVSGQARSQFFARPFFTSAGKRSPEAEINWKGQALFPGAFNPPHAGHFGIANEGGPAVFAITANPPHKEALSLSEMLRRAALLEGHNRLFTEGDALYAEKARRFPGIPILIGVDACLRMLGPQWGVPLEPLLEVFEARGTRFRVANRGEGIEAVWRMVPDRARYLFTSLSGEWSGSSTEIRAKMSA